MAISMTYNAHNRNNRVDKIPYKKKNKPKQAYNNKEYNRASEQIINMARELQSEPTYFTKCQNYMEIGGESACKVGMDMTFCSKNCAYCIR